MAAPNWGVELWDCDKLVMQRMENCMGFLEKTKEFMQNRAKIEAQYAKDMKALVEFTAKQFRSSAEKEDLGNTSIVTSWEMALKETTDMYKQHEKIASDLTTKIISPMKIVRSKQKAEHEKFGKEISKHQKVLEKSEHQFEQKKKTFEKHTKDEADTRHKLQTAEGKHEMVKVKKLEDEVKSAAHRTESSKVEFDLGQAQVIHARTIYYKEHLCSIINQVQKVETEDCVSHAQYLKTYATTHQEVHDINEMCIKGLETATATVNPADDIAKFVVITKTGCHPDERIKPVTGSAKQRSVQEINHKRVTKTKLFKTTTRKKDAIRDDFGHLPPEQRKRAIRDKLAELRAAHTKENKVAPQLESMISKYTEDPAFGDEKSKKKLILELNEIKKNVAHLDTEIYKFELYLSLIEGTDAPTAKVDASPTSAPRKESDLYENLENLGEEEDFEEDFSDDESTSTSVAATPTITSPKQEEAVDDMPEAQTAKAAYDFAGDNPGEIKLVQGESLSVVEADAENTGWVRVVNTLGVEGYVPTTYLEMNP
eukprot:m.260652 g.260652  ORF g.260652 m.260652 type:complete len:540 (+) comp40408_c0_seq1:262-1881(+)